MRLLLALLLALPLAAQRPLHVNADKDGLALYGYDVVAYHTLGAPTVGRADITATWEGATWRFATADHRDRFLKDPARYAPQYGGFCAYGVAGDYKVKVEPDAWRIVAGKLYLNYDRRVQERWSRDIAGYIAKAEANWPALRPRARRD
ncbi:MAG TPA: YHS domain-containing (seleno)protein [Gemmatimonadales bacterium]|nr:YHS domain-containing (seleno)protein [Gemmatimonadales bacterium]